MKEVWKDIKGYKDLYQVSNFGQVKSLDRKKRNGVFISGRLMKLSSDRYGYKYVELANIDGKRKKEKVHRLVALAFIPNLSNKPTVNHLDEDKENNCVTNLEWATHLEQRHWGSRKRDLNVKVIATYPNGIDECFSSIKRAAIFLKVDRSSISKANSQGGMMSPCFRMC